MNKPFLVGQRICLRPLNPEDAEGSYLEWFNDEEVCQGNGHHFYPFLKEDALAFIQTAQIFRDEITLAI